MQMVAILLELYLEYTNVHVPCGAVGVVVQELLKNPLFVNLGLSLNVYPHRLEI